MSLHVFVLEMKKLLGGLDGWLTKAVAHAEAKKFDPGLLLQQRLAPDMFPLIRQIQSACDHANFAASRCAGKEPPSFPDTEQTLDEVRSRIARVIAHLDTFKHEDFADAEERKIRLPRWEGKSMTAIDYFAEFAQPNFYFHVAMAYAILRHNGVELGKRDFLGTLSLR
jgi:hypothetical protein